MKQSENPIRLDDLAQDHPLRQVPFTVPDHYFDELPSRVQARVARRSKRAFTISWSWQRTAASLAGAGLIAVLVWQTLPERQESLGSEALSGVSHATIAAYLEEQGVNAYELADSEQLQQSLGNDTTVVKYLDVQPEDIRQHIDEQNVIENLSLDS